MHIDWVFFDMGGVLIDDQQLMCFFYRELWERSRNDGVDLSPGDVLTLREELIEAGDQRHWVTAGQKLIGDNWDEVYLELVNKMRSQYVKMCRLFPGMDETVLWAKENFKIGLAANQFIECRAVLENFKLLESFDLLGISEEMGYKKPEKEFFQWLIDKSGADPEKCIMIGDRIDNDVIPARDAGMKTIWLKLKPDYDALMPADEFRDAYVESHQRASLLTRCPECDAEEPDEEAHTVDELKAAIIKIAGGQ